MEDLLILILQAILEILLQIVAELPWDWVLYRKEDSLEHRPWFCGILSLAAGVLMAQLSLAFLPHVLVHHFWMRILNLFLSPLSTGWFSYELAVLRRRRNPAISPRRHFFFSLLFALGFAIIRFTYAAR